MLQAAAAIITAAILYGVLTVSASATDAPQRYASGPYLAPIVVRNVPLPHLQRVCARFGKNQSNGCAILTRKHCYIYLRAGMEPVWRGGVLKHEQAHCRGWAARHPP